jgi:membrane associated rhomboid family serine protease
MNNITRLLLFFVLPLVAVLSYPPDIFLSNPTGAYLLILVAVVFALLAYMLYRGSSRALTLSIFIQGLNVIIRIMMFFPHSVSRAGTFDWTYMTFSIIGLALSSYLMLRLDRPDIRARLVS